MQNLVGKVAIVTGTSSGIGLATSNTLLAAGCLVLGVDIAAAPSITNSNFHFYQADLAHAGAPQNIVEACQKAFGSHIDILLNVAGVLDANSGVDTLLDEDWDRVIAINLTAPVRLMREVLKVMKEQKSGSIVNVSSKAGLSGAVAGVAYTASKHGLIGVTKNTAWIFKDDNIRCNAICPGAIDTNIGQTINPESWDLKALATMQPVHNLHFDPPAGKTATSPSVVADLLVYLASDLSRGINGAIIPIDNAWSVI